MADDDTEMGKVISQKWLLSETSYVVWYFLWLSFFAGSYLMTTENSTFQKHNKSLKLKSLLYSLQLRILQATTVVARSVSLPFPLLHMSSALMNQTAIAFLSLHSFSCHTLILCLYSYPYRTTFPLLSSLVWFGFLSTKCRCNFPTSSPLLGVTSMWWIKYLTTS